MMGYSAIIPGTASWLALIAASCLSMTALAELPAMPEPLGKMELPDRPAGEHWIWIGDFQDGNYGRSILFNADTGAMLGAIDIGWEGIKLDFPRARREIYNLAMFMSRGFRGERTDVITTFDKRTLQPQRELVVPAKGIHGWPDPNHTALSDDDRFLFMQFLTPAASIGVADVKAGKYIGEVETTGCAHVMAGGSRRFFTLCGDGSLLAIDLTEEGKEASRKRYRRFFDANRDPLHGSGMRIGDTWYFVSYLGQIHPVDVSGPGLKPLATWPVAQKEGRSTWIPGAFMQPLALHAGRGRLYVAMQLSDLEPKGGGTDYHAEPGTEIWVFDLQSNQRLRRIATKHPVTHLAVSQDAAALLYGNGMWDKTVTVYDEATGRALRDIVVQTYPTLLQPVE